MNLLGLIFSIILILSFGTYACFEKQVTSSRLRTTYLSHQRANRKILNSYQSKVYQQIRGCATAVKKQKETLPVTEDDDATEILVTFKEPNRECAKINLWSLIEEGKEAHFELYELTAKLILKFYPDLQSIDKRFHYSLLDQLLKASKRAIRDNEHFCVLEKVKLEDERLQKAYYYMLKGTKKWDLAKGIGYPSFLDYVQATPDKSKICISHADLNLLTLLFNEKAAKALYEKIHQKEKPALTLELIENICKRAQLNHLDPVFLNLFELGYPSHQESKKVFVAEDGNSGVSLRKNIYIKTPG